MAMSLVVNGVRREVVADPATPLLWVLRDDVGDQSPKYGCGAEQCGSCMVLVAHNAGQCGYCLPGIVVTLTDVVRRGEALDADGVRRALDDHLCRCGAQPRIVRAALEALDALAGAAGTVEQAEQAEQAGAAPAEHVGPTAGERGDGG